MIPNYKWFPLLLIFVFGCGTTKNTVVTETLPDWVKAKPVISGYYVGVGSAAKTIDVQDQQKTAKNNALADLTSEISVNISSQSVLNKFESSLGYSEDFTSSIKTSVAEQLEGYELVSTYESASRYYVMYKLSKEKFETIKQQRKTDASKKALDFYEKALQFQNQADYSNAACNYIMGLEAIRNYYNETVECEQNGKTINLGNDILSGFTTLINSIQIIPSNSVVDGTKGNGISSDQLTFTLKSSDGKLLQGIPVIFSLGSQPLRGNKTESNSQGNVSYSYSGKITNTGSVNFIAEVDGNLIATQCTNDPLLRRMLRKFEMPQGKILITMKNPSIFIQTVEKNFGTEMNPKILNMNLERLFANNNYPVVYKVEQADYIIVVNVDTERDRKEGRMHYALVKGEVKVLNTNQQLVYVKAISQINGMQLNYESAGLDAYNNLVEYMNRYFLPKFKEVLVE